MTEPWQPPSRGALDDTEWPEQLLARATERGAADDRLHGYAVLGDVAAHYRFSDLIYLSITGDLPSDQASALFHLALCAYATVSVGESPAHVSVLGRLSGSTLASALGAGMIAAADQAHHKVLDHASLLTWIANPTESLPVELRSDTDRTWVQTLREAVARHTQVDVVHPQLTRDGALIAVLYAAGVRGFEQIVAAIVASRVCGIAAEALATGSQHLSLYPVKVPQFCYVEDPRRERP